VYLSQGCNIWITDSKNRYPLFICAFFGRLDCVCFLIEVAINTGKQSALVHKDIQGDTALHAAALRGHLSCCEILSYYVRDEANGHGILAHQLAQRVGQARIANVISFYTNQFSASAANGNVSDSASAAAEIIFECKFDVLSSVLLYYGSRWTKLYDVGHGSVYYYDRVTGWYS
jgi:ankyrin repeat protein